MCPDPTGLASLNTEEISTWAQAEGRQHGAGEKPAEQPGPGENPFTLPETLHLAPSPRGPQRTAALMSRRASLFELCLCETSASFPLVSSRAVASVSAALRVHGRLSFTKSSASICPSEERHWRVMLGARTLSRTLSRGGLAASTGSSLRRAGTARGAARGGGGPSALCQGPSSARGGGAGTEAVRPHAALLGSPLGVPLRARCVSPAHRARTRGPAQSVCSRAQRRVDEEGAVTLFLAHGLRGDLGAELGEHSHVFGKARKSRLGKEAPRSAQHQPGPRGN